MTDNEQYKSNSQHTRPIIVVPTSEQLGNICLKNAVQFLRDGKYQPPQQVVQTIDEKYETKKVFEKRIGGNHDGINVTFEIYDSVAGFTSKEWSRVICLFSNGETFQFKDWPSGNDNQSN